MTPLKQKLHVYRSQNTTNSINAHNSSCPTEFSCRQGGKKPLGLRSDHHLTLNVSAESRANAIMFGGFYVSSVHIFKPTDIF